MLNEGNGICYDAALFKEECAWQTIRKKPIW